MMPASRYILTTFLCLALPALPALSQSAETNTETALPTAPLTVQTGAPTDSNTSVSPLLWASPSDLIHDEIIAISPARSGSTDILSCPFEALRAAYLSLFEDTDALNVAALESEVFKVCIERQKQVKQLLDNEARLRTQLGDVVSAAMNTQTRIIAARVIAAPSEANIAEEKQDTPPPPETFRAAKSAALNQSALPQCADRYTSGPVFGATTLDGGLHAFVYDATRGTRLTVKAGDTLPGGVIIARISIEDGVIVSEQGIERQLARTLTAPAFDDGGGLLFKTVSLNDVYKLDSDWETLE